MPLSTAAVPQLPRVEGMGDEAPRGVGDQDRSRFRHLLQARGEVDRQPHRHAVLDGDQAGGDAHAHRDAQIGNGADDFQPALMACTGASSTAAGCPK